MEHEKETMGFWDHHFHHGYKIVPEEALQLECAPRARRKRELWIKQARWDVGI